MNRPAVHLLILAGACVVTFWNTLNNGFHLDDAFRVVNNEGIQEFWPPWRHFFDETTCASVARLVQYRPMLPLSLSINYAIAGHSVVSYHIGNLVLQILASGALYLLVRELLTRWCKRTYPSHAALLIAGLFAVHPLSGVLVNYVCGRDLLLMQMFTLSALFCYVRMRRLGPSAGRWAVVVGLFLLALLSKKNAVALPAVVLLFELGPAAQSIRDGAMWRRVGVFAGCVAAVLLFIEFGLGFSDFDHVVTHSPKRYAAAQSQHHTFHYLANFAWPFPIRQLADDPVVMWKQIVGGFVIAGAIALAWRWRRAHPLRMFCILSYAVMIALTSSLIPMHSEIVPYRAYPSSPYLFLLVGLLVLRSARIGTIVLGVSCVYFAGASIAMNRHWQDGEDLMRHSIAYGGNNIAYGALAEKLPIGVEKERMFLKAIELEPNFLGAHLGLAMTHVRMGKREEGLARLEDWVNNAPENPQVLYAAGRILAMARLYEKAIEISEAAVRLAPRSIEYRYMAGSIAIEAQRYDKALELLGPIVQSQPGHKLTRLYVGTALVQLGRGREAIPVLTPFVAHLEADPRGWYELGRAKMSVADWRGAVEAFEGCLRAESNFRDARTRLATCRQKLGG